jgi:prevent-host-death family protein
VIEVSIAEIKNRLTQLIHRAEAGEVVHVTRRGKAVAVLLSEAEYERLRRYQPQRGFWDAIQAMRADPAFEPVDFTREEVDSWRDRAGGRDFSWED